MRKDDILSRLTPVLSSQKHFSEATASSNPSAVLVIIHYHDHTPHIFLTKRSSSLKMHRGEISFPGGRFIEQDVTLLATALRETEEEIGLSFQPAQILGSLHPVRTMTSSHFIVPFLTVQEKLPEHRLAPSEVEAVLDAPLVETLSTASPDVEHYGLDRDAFKFMYHENIIWGATARIMKQLHDLLID